MSNDEFREYNLNPINGTQFKGNDGNRVIFEVPASHFILGREVRLNLKILNTSPSQQRLGVSPTAGASSVIQRIDFFNLTGDLLESLQNYNQIASLFNQYTYDDASNISSLEGCSQTNISREFNIEDNELNEMSISMSTKNPEDLVLSPIDKENGEAKYNYRLYSIPIYAGLFGAFDKTQKLLPLPLLNGLRMVVYLEDPNTALVNVTSDENVDLIQTGLSCEDVLAVQKFVLLDGVGQYLLKPYVVSDPIVLTLEDLVDELTIKYKIGDPLTLKGEDENDDMQSYDLVLQSMVMVGNFLTLTCTPVTDIPVALPGVENTIEFTISQTTIASTGFSVGNFINIKGGDPTAIVSNNVKIVSMSLDATTKKVKITIAEDIPITVDVSVLLNSQDKAYNVEPTLSIMSVIPASLPPMKNFQYQFTTYDLFLNTISSQSLNAQIEIQSVSTMAKSILTMYSDVGNNSLYTTNASIFQGLFPEDTTINSIQYYLNNRYQPVRPYNPVVGKDMIINQHELKKALEVINKTPSNMGFNNAQNLDNYTCTYLHALRLATGDFIFDLSQAEPQIRLGFSEVRANNIMATTMVFCNKIISVDGTGIRILQ